MTNDYKKILLDYITELKPGEATSEERIFNINEVAREEWFDYLPSAWLNFTLNGAIKSNTSDKIVFYGAYIESQGNNHRGIIIITDNDLNPIQTIYEFSSGTKLRPIICMIQEEDGQFVAIDSQFMYYTSSYIKQLFYGCEKRFIMLSDISIPVDNEYQVNLRTSYILGNDYKNFLCKDIFKNPNSSHYFMAGSQLETSGNYSPVYIKIINLKINVGSANEWSTHITSTKYIYGGCYCYFDNNDDAYWKILISPNNNDNTMRCWYGKNGNEIDSIVLWTPSYKTYIDEDHFECQSVFINENLVYFTTNNQYWGNSGVLRPKYIGLYQYDFTTNTLTEIYLKYLGDYDWSYLDLIQLYAVNGELYIEYCTNVNTNNDTADYYLQRYNGEWNPILIKEQAPYQMEYRAFYVSQTFNLLKAYFIPINPRVQNWGMIETTEIYNISNYNGEPYENYNSLKSKYVNIYSNDELVFSRNLHNISITNNYTISTVEIPNTYLNGINLNPKNLIGETNTTLVEDGNTISKNIYEILYLNYINTINVKDNENNIVNDVGRYINTNINVGTQTNQENTKCTKICINYSDNSNKIFPIYWIKINDTKARTTFSFYVDKEISNIEFISNDETTIYITVKPELEIGNYYTIRQDLRIE